MSALDDILKYGNATPNINEWIAWSQQARAELAQLRATVAEARELLTTLEWYDWNDRVDAWLAANPAPQEDAKQ